MVGTSREILGFRYDGAIFDNHLSRVWALKARVDADERVPVLL